jgi:hypothetical protein
MVPTIDFTGDRDQAIHLYSLPSVVKSSYAIFRAFRDWDVRLRLKSHIVYSYNGDETH